MALGSSAPEILLSLIEIVVQNDMFLGDLGAGTIVGSAAFNLLVISAVCVCAVPEPEVRYIKQTSVYIITATFSVFAYIWLMFILMVFSPNVCTITEAVVTLLFCPLLVALAFLADKGYFERNGESQRGDKQAIPNDVTLDELAQIEQQIKEQYGPELSAEQVMAIMTAKYFTTRSRAYYKHMAMKQAVARRQSQRLSMASAFSLKRRESESKDLPTVGPPDLTVNTVFGTSDTLPRDREKSFLENEVEIGFECARYAFLEDCGHAQIVLVRSGPTHCRASVTFKTRDGTATSLDDYEAKQDTVVFEKDETKKTIKIKILDDNAYEENEEFYIDLYDVSIADDSECGARLGEISTVCVVIIDDDDAGLLRFEQEEVTVEEEVESSVVEVVVERVGGASGKITCKYETEDHSAIDGADFTAVSGRLELGPSVQKATIQIPILPKGRYFKTAAFIVRLTDATGGIFDKETDGGEECCICCVTIKGKQDSDRLNALKQLETKIISQQAMLSHRHWGQQFYDALFTIGDNSSDDDDEETESPPPGRLEILMHFVSMPWRLFSLSCLQSTTAVDGAVLSFPWE
jgi:solute carrier family 8 (sodium/calcium exchanger)